MRLSRRRVIAQATMLVGLFAALGSVARAVDATLHVVSQKGRAFQPGELDIKKDETVQLFNDDGDLLHHAYIESDRFNFDSGDQEPGSRTNVKFPVSGAFTVLCGIHPKMKLEVRVH